MAAFTVDQRQEEPSLSHKGREARGEAATGSKRGNERQKELHTRELLAVRP